jgi:hypothetical protein
MPELEPPRQYIFLHRPYDSQSRLYGDVKSTRKNPDSYLVLDHNVRYDEQKNIDLHKGSKLGGIRHIRFGT